ncbi:MAG: cysteine--tRNA ligase [Planctomycetes bacterium]|nr:cysteine--tRNA ligase [Planctomycetota bacterium]
MTIRFFNTYTRRLEDFVPLETGVVRMYNCGPTVYDFAHIGNFRSFLMADLLRRFLEWKGFAVRQVMNLTDVGHLTDDDVDRMEVGSGREKKTAWEIADFYAEAFLEDSRRLGLAKAWENPRATRHIPEMIELNRKLVEKGLAYFSKDSLYFEVQKFPGYGRLSGNTLDELEAGARVEVRSEKRDPRDFALWKADPRHQMKWESPWGVGFPGWHVECSAMSMKYLGETLDIHTGGEDNIFPHHDCEIAQSEGATGRPFVRHWLHARFLLVGGEKMSKSLGNFYTVRDLAAAGYEGRAIRWALLDGHYRQPANFAVEGKGEAARFVSLESAAGSLRTLDNLATKLRFAAAPGADPELPEILAKARREFDEALSDDLDISRARRAIFELAGELNRRDVPRTDAAVALSLVREFDAVLGFLPAAEAELPAEVRELVLAREAARKDRNWSLADELRARIRERGYVVEDTPRGPVWKKA